MLAYRTPHEAIAKAVYPSDWIRRKLY